MLTNAPKCNYVQADAKNFESDDMQWSNKYITAAHIEHKPFRYSIVDTNGSK
jgi:hypothetical protein